jgi:RimJ/RimL family protein N-acetyltransferase
MQIKRLDPENLQTLEAFLASCGSSLETFRYFSSRPLQVVENHLTTLLGFNETHAPVCYGHLDPEDGVVWLGICVAEGHVGKGYGHRMMQALIDTARELKLDAITLTVDIANSPAVHLYEKCGFQLEREVSGTCFFKLNL